MKKAVLIVEDYDDARAFMIMIVRALGYEIYEATNGQEAVEITEEKHPDLILMDISMPVMDGISATKIIRNAKSDISQIPIIAVSAFSDDYKHEALKAGCNDFIKKPVMDDRMKIILKKYLGDE